MKTRTRWSGLLILISSFSVLGQNISDSQEKPTATAEPAIEVQEVKYVTDMLRLSLYNRADSNSGTLKLLSSGDVLEVISRSGPYSRVRTEAGQIGWVKNGFLVSTPTANLQLVDEIKKNKDLTSQLEKFSDSQQMVQNYETTIDQLKMDLDDRDQQLDQSKQSLQQLSEDNMQLQQNLENLQQNTFEISDIFQLLKQFWYVAAVSFLMVFFLGLVIGRGIVETRVRRKFQGVKVW